MELTEREQRQRWSQLRELMCDWDPIGIMDNADAPRDEYDCLLGPLLTRLASSASGVDIANYLRDEIVGHFGLSPMHNDFNAVAKRVHAWYAASCVKRMTVSITGYSPAHQSAIRRILERIGWAEQYIVAAEQNAEAFSHDQSLYGVFLAVIDSSVVGFIYVQFHEWNRLAQIEGLAVDPSYHRQGVASELVKKAEGFAKERGARGIYVDTPTLNQKGRSFYEAIGYSYGYEMPRYYEDNLDGVTYQKFFDETPE